MKKYPKILAALIPVAFVIGLYTFAFHNAKAGNGDIQMFESGTNSKVPPTQVTIPASTNAVLATNASGQPATIPNLSVLSGTCTSSGTSLPAAPPLTIYFSLSNSGSTAAVYLKVSGTGSTGWWLMTSGTAAVQ